MIVLIGASLGAIIGLISSITGNRSQRLLVFKLHFAAWSCLHTVT
jgi:hypothetical protein